MKLTAWETTLTPPRAGTITWLPPQIFTAVFGSNGTSDMENKPGQQETDLHYMDEALREARVAAELDEVPVGAVVVAGDRIIARGHNQTEKLTDCTAHAEMIALTSACNYLGSKYLPDATLYVTLEPC